MSIESQPKPLTQEQQKHQDNVLRPRGMYMDKLARIQVEIQTLIDRMGVMMVWVVQKKSVNNCAC
ncbi:MAG: hypothetical protein HZA36_02085 [Parcubacteria group bacterium]|nr:hypothetical protein [Parcubacteria group bacterium]